VSFDEANGQRDAGTREQEGRSEHQSDGDERANTKCSPKLRRPDGKVVVDVVVRQKHGIAEAGQEKKRQGAD